MPYEPAPLLPVAVRPPEAPIAEASPAARLVAAFLSGRSPQTLRAYSQDLEDFRRWCSAPRVADAAGLLLGRGHGEANALGLAYRAQFVERGLSPATVNRRLAALQSLVALGKMLGMVAWSLDVPGVKGETYRDTAGPRKRGFRKLLDQAGRRGDAKGLRDRAVLRLLHDLGLRRAEVCRLDVEDLDLADGTLAVLGKGRAQKVKLTLPDPTREALTAWLAVRPAEDPQAGAGAPLFTSCDRARKGSGRLTGKGCYQLVRALGNAVGLKVWPHAIRHTAITSALDATGGDVRKVQRFSRHRDVRTLLRYDDARNDVAGEVAKRVAKGAG